MSEPLFVVTVEDLSLLEGWQIDSVWTSLGVIVKARAKVVRGATERPVALQSSDDAATPVASPEPAESLDIPREIIPETIPEPVAEVLDPPPPPAPSRRPTRPLGETTVPCDPGCGLQIPQQVIGAHRRTCAAVLAFKAERGVTVVPDLLGSAAPLPDVLPSDFDAKRQANAHEAAERSWRGTHLDVDPAGKTAAEVRRSTKALTLHQAEVVVAVREHRGIRPAAEARGWTYQAVANVVSLLRRSGRLPADVATLLDGRRADGWKLRRAGAEAAS